MGMSVRQMVEEALVKEEQSVKKGKTDFWAGKTTCYQLCHCPSAIRDECPATKHNFLPCWEIEGTYCKLQKKGKVTTGTDTSICKVCRVYKKYGDNKPIQLKLLGKGIDATMNSQQAR